MTKSVETRTHEFWLDDAGIIQGIAFPGMVHHIEDAQAATDAYNELSQGKLRPVLVDMSKIKGIDKECRSYYAGKEHCDSFKAVALVVGTRVTRVIGNFFLGLNKPLNPTRIVDSEQEGLDWLKQFMEE